MPETQPQTYTISFTEIEGDGCACKSSVSRGEMNRWLQNPERRTLAQSTFVTVLQAMEKASVDVENDLREAEGRMLA